jgi:hypothetical protein
LAWQAAGAAGVELVDGVRQLRGMFATTDLIDPSAKLGIRLSSSQVYRLVVERPERLSLKILMALLDILGCSMGEPIEPAAAAGGRARTATTAGSGAGVGTLRPTRARITAAGTSLVRPPTPDAVTHDAITDPLGVLVDLLAGIETGPGP